uniref:Putative F-box/LRR-repeat protein 10 n=1 Tax=Davidia involucrata TaxID=16924 RepID=A0A5B7AHW9_DAVIN
MQVDGDRWHGSTYLAVVALLDLYNCGGITQLAFWWLKKLYFLRLKWMVVTGSMNRDMVDALARSSHSCMWLVVVRSWGLTNGTTQMICTCMNMKKWLKGENGCDDEVMEMNENDAKMIRVICKIFLFMQFLMAS